MKDLINNANLDRLSYLFSISYFQPNHSLWINDILFYYGLLTSKGGIGDSFGKKSLILTTRIILSRLCLTILLKLFGPIFGGANTNALESKF